MYSCSAIRIFGICVVLANHALVDHGSVISFVREYEAGQWTHSSEAKSVNMSRHFPSGRGRNARRPTQDSLNLSIYIQDSCKGYQMYLLTHKRDIKSHFHRHERRYLIFVFPARSRRRKRTTNCGHESDPPDRVWQLGLLGIPHQSLYRSPCGRLCRRFRLSSVARH